MKSIKKLVIIFLQRLAIVIVLIFFFSLLFQFFESPHPANEYKNEEEKVEDRNKIISRSWRNLSKKYNLNVSLSEYMFLMQDLEELSSEVKNARLQKTPWSFMKCLYLTFTIVTTIGYGDVTPRTATGMWLTIVAGFMGIPIMVVTLKTQGELINCFIHFVIKFVERKIMKRSSVKHLEGKTLIITFVMVWSLLLSCAAMEKKYHNWTLLEGIYAWFISISTIGFGDYVVRLHTRNQNNEDSLVSLVITFLLISFGLGIISGVINAFGDFLVRNRQVRNILTICFGFGAVRLTPNRPNDASLNANVRYRRSGFSAVKRTSQSNLQTRLENVISITEVFKYKDTTAIERRGYLVSDTDGET